MIVAIGSDGRLGFSFDLETHVTRVRLPEGSRFVDVVQYRGTDSQVIDRHLMVQTEPMIRMSYSAMMIMLEIARGSDRFEIIGEPDIAPCFDCLSN